MMREVIAAIIVLSATCAESLAADSTKILSPAARAVTASGEKSFYKAFDPIAALAPAAADGAEDGEATQQPDLRGAATQ